MKVVIVRVCESMINKNGDNIWERSKSLAKNATHGKAAVRDNAGAGLNNSPMNLKMAFDLDDCDIFRQCEVNWVTEKEGHRKASLQSPQDGFLSGRWQSR